jgi:ferritin-like metal-binding protein YciE
MKKEKRSFAYGTARTFATELGHDEVASLLKDTEEEECNADKKLTKISEGGLLKTGVTHKANLKTHS